VPILTYFIFCVGALLNSGNAQGRASVDSPGLQAHYWPNKPASFSVCIPHLSQKYLPTHSPIARFTTPCDRQSAPLCICRSGHYHPPHAPSSCVARSSLLPVTRLTRASRSLLPQSYPHHRARRPPLLVLVVPSRAPSQSPLSQGHPRARPVLVVLARCRSASAPTPRSESTDPGHSLPLCYKCMFQVFQMLSDVCCKRFIWMLQK
jgi:hypothetical protein